MKTIIKTIIITVCLSLAAADLRSSTNHNPKYDSLSCLQVEGRVLNADDETGEDCFVELINIEGEIDSLVLREGKKKFKFVLSKNSYYALRISKKGYISKLISVNTELEIQPEGIYKFVFEISLLREEAIKRLNEDALDFPVAIVHFDYEKECFSYNKEYTDNIKKELHKPKPSKNKIVPVIYTKKGSAPSVY